MAELDRCVAQHHLRCGLENIKGTTEWQQHSVVLDVPANAAALAYGFFVQGTGQA
jgi:hypothetical protein